MNRSGRGGRGKIYHSTPDGGVFHFCGRANLSQPMFLLKVSPQHFQNSVWILFWKTFFAKCIDEKKNSLQRDF